MDHESLLEAIRVAVAECIEERTVLDIGWIAHRLAATHPQITPAMIEEELTAAGLSARVPMKLGSAERAVEPGRTMSSQIVLPPQRAAAPEPAGPHTLTVRD